MRLFPLFLKLRGRHCLVVGGGKISEGKVAGLLSTGARITLVSPEVTPRIAAWHRRGQLHWKKRKFRVTDLKGVFLVVAATSSSRSHQVIFRQARKRGILCNIVDIPELCDFYYPAVLQRGNLQIAISTGGASPTLAKRIRKQFENIFGREYGPWLKALARKRKVILGRNLAPAHRMQLLEELAAEESFADYRQRLLKNKRAARTPNHAHQGPDL